MVSDFRDDLRGSMDGEGDDRVEALMRAFYAGPSDFKLDWSPRDAPYVHDFEVMAHDRLWKWEEKRRRKDWGDELLEDVSNDRTGSDGWTRKCESVDYVLFTYPGGRSTIWPGAELQWAFMLNRRAWLKASGYRRAPNQGYCTLNIPVATDELRRAVAAAGAPSCVHCGESVGRFGFECSDPRCLNKTCCAITDAPEEWECPSCFSRAES